MSIFPAMVAALMLASPAASETESPVATVRAFYAAAADSDWQRAMSLFSTSSDTRLRRQIRDDLRVHCVEIESLRVQNVEAGEETAAVETVAHIIRHRLLDGPVLDEVEQRRFVLRHEDGGWRIVSMPMPEDILAEQIGATKTDDEVTALLARNPHLIGPKLMRRLLTYAASKVQAADGLYDTRLTGIVRRISAAIDDKSSLAIAMSAEANALRETSQLTPQALRAMVLEAVRIAEESKDPNAIGFSLLSVSSWAAKFDQLAESERVMREAMQTPRSYLASHVSAMQANLGLALFVRADYAGAYRVLTEGLPLDLAEDFQREAAFKEVHIGRIMAAQNDPQTALEYFLRASQRPGHTRFVIMAHVGAAQAYLALGRLDEAKAAGEKALSIARPTPYKGMTASAFAALGEIAIARGDTAGTEETLQQALAYAREAKYGAAVMQSLLSLGNFYYRQGRFADAQRIAVDAVSVLPRSEGIQMEQYATLMLVGRVEQALGNREQAIATYRNAIDAIESARGVVAGGDRQRELFFEPYHAAYTEIAGLLFEQGSTEEALLYAERGKGRVLLDALARERSRAVNALPEKERQKLTAAVQALGEANKRLLSLRVAKTASDAGIAAARAEQRRAQIALEELDAHVATLDPALRTVNSAAVIERGALESLVPREDFAILEYVTHERGVDLVVVRAHGGKVVLSRHRIDVRADELSQRIDRFVRQLAGRGLDYRRQGRALHDLLLSPAASELAGKRVLCIIPDGALWHLPFEALITSDGTFLLERASCFYVPSISVYREMLEREGRGPRATTLAAFGDPALGGSRERVSAVYRDVQLDPLPEAEREARDIARLWQPGSAVYTGPKAHEAAAKHELTRSRIVHFAAHGLFDDANPMFSQIILATDRQSPEDGSLQAWELMRLDLRADLVVLSACETARGRVGAGEGLIGMSWALFAGGCPATVASQWNVASGSTAKLMVAFHRNLAQRPRGTFAKAEALRAAKLSLLKNQGTAQPFHWAAFVLIGSAAWR